MHYYKFNIGDYRRKAHHLSLLEHGIYRQLLDQYYLDEKPFPDDLNAIMRSLCVRTKVEKEAFRQIISEFFLLDGNKLIHRRCEKELEAIYEKSEKARASAQARWGERNANAKRTVCETDAKDMLPKDTTTLLPKDTNSNKATRFIKPTVEEIKNYCDERENKVDPEIFFDHYETNNWFRGKTKIKDWKACVRTWEKRDGQNNGTSKTYGNNKLSSAERSEAAIDEAFGNTGSILDGDFERIN